MNPEAGCHTPGSPAAGDDRGGAAHRLLVVDLGQRSYAEVLEYQREVAKQRITGEVADDVLILVEHPPVITFGRSTKPQHLLASPTLLTERGVELFEVERGGDITFHGPGQLVGYPIIDLSRHRKDLHWYLRQLEEALILTLNGCGLAAGRNAPHTGVWVGDRKIASIGVHARQWVTWHGFALNITTDLGYFDLIVPCGIPQVRMTSIAREMATQAVDGRAVVASVVDAFATVFALEPVAVSEAGLARTSPPLLIHLSQAAAEQTVVETK